MERERSGTGTVRNGNATNNRITPLTSDSDEDLSTPAEIADSLFTYFQSVFVKEKTVDEGLSQTSLAEPVPAATMMKKLYSHLKLKIEKSIT